MNYLFKGSLYGYLCENCSEPLGNIEVLLYRPWQTEKIVEHVIADTKETFHLVTKEESVKKGYPIATVKTDSNGNFEFTLDEKWGNTAFDIDLICSSVPHMQAKQSRRNPIQLHLTTLYPQWRLNREQESYFFQWEYYISNKWWCQIRGNYFDAWVICGYLRHCKTRQPIANASVTAWDADFLTDDNLGTAVTDANGHFRIDYTSIQFKQTFLSPLINVETDPGLPLTFQSGPDVYFKAEIKGVNLLNETAADKRKNVGYCLCVNLCSEVSVVPPGNPGNFPSAWTGIGSEFDVSGIVPARSFDPDGYAGIPKYALTSIINLTGQAAYETTTHIPIKYRFRISAVTTDNGTTPPDLSNFTQIVGVTPGLFASRPVATLLSSLNHVATVWSDQSDFDANGWFDLNHAIARTINQAKVISPTPAEWDSYTVIDSDTLLSLNTTALITNPPQKPDILPGSVAVGVSVPVNTLPVTKVAILFEIGVVTGSGPDDFDPIAGSGTILNSVVVNNNNVFMKLAVSELEATTLCTPISGDIHAKYTVYHPHLASSSLYLSSNSGSVHRDITDAFLPKSGNTSHSIQGGANNNLKLNNPPSDLIKCTYSLKLYARARLHDGVNAWSDSGPVEQIFFYDI